MYEELLENLWSLTMRLHMQMTTNSDQLVVFLFGLGLNRVLDQRRVHVALDGEVEDRVQAGRYHLARGQRLPQFDRVLLFADDSAITAWVAGDDELAQ